MKLRSYPKVYSLGHAAVLDIFAEPVVVQEKVDGSQFSFGKINGELILCSKNKRIIPDEDCPSLFEPAVNHVLRHQDHLQDGWIYRGEAFYRPKHNTLTYNRVPAGNIMLFDVEAHDQDFLSPDHLFVAATAIGVECVPTVYWGLVTGLDQLVEHLDRESVLGGQKVEGLVVKAYGRFLRDGKTMMGKYVSERFKEAHRRSSKVVGNKDIVAQLVGELTSEARWEKAVQHLRDSGELADEPRDIGRLVKEVQRDVLDEESDYIKDQLFKWASKNIGRGVVRGLPEWYKQRLMEASFEGVSTDAKDTGHPDMAEQEL